MNKKLGMLALGLLLAGPVAAQNELQYVLESIERNNLTLQAEHYASQGRTYEARMGNSLEPLSVAYESVGEGGLPVGQAGELEISQEFALPMLYAARNRKARSLASQYEAEYLALRQQTLLEAKEIYLELCALQAIVAVNRPRMQAAEHLARLYETRYQTGDATLIDKNRAEFEELLLRESLSTVDLRIIELERRLTTLNGGQPLACSYVMPPMETLSPLDSLQADWEAYAPDLTVARLQAEAAGDDVKVSRREALPRLGLGYKATYGEGSYNNGLTAGLSIPLFSNRHNVKRAQAYERAARAEAEAAVVEKRNTVNELYAKTDYAARLLQSFDIMPDADSYVGVLVRLLESGQMNIIDYYSELDTLYQTLETRIRIEMEYRLGVARLLVIYL